jgi:hypothetical protein
VATASLKPIAFTIAILVAATSANTSSSNRDCNGVSERTISIRKETQAKPLSSKIPCG